MSFTERLADDVIRGLQDQHQSRDKSLLVWHVAKKSASAYDGGTTNAHGDHDGTADPYTLFTVDGDVAVKAVVGIINTTVVSTSNNGTVEVGVAGNTAKLIAQTTAGSGALADGDVLTDAGAEAGIDIAASSGALYFINDGADIIETLATNNFTAGQIDWYCIWAPLERNANVVAA